MKGHEDEIIEWCGRLPLALAILAGRVAARPRQSLATVADLPRTREELNELTDAALLDEDDNGMVVLAGMPPAG